MPLIFPNPWENILQIAGWVFASGIKPIGLSWSALPAPWQSSSRWPSLVSIVEKKMMCCLGALNMFSILTISNCCLILIKSKIGPVKYFSIRYQDKSKYKQWSWFQFPSFKHPLACPHHNPHGNHKVTFEKKFFLLELIFAIFSLSELPFPAIFKVCLRHLDFWHFSLSASFCVIKIINQITKKETDNRFSRCGKCWHFPWQSMVSIRNLTGTK